MAAYESDEFSTNSDMRAHNIIFRIMLGPTLVKPRVVSSQASPVTEVHRRFCERNSITCASQEVQRRRDKEG